VIDKDREGKYDDSEGMRDGMRLQRVWYGSFAAKEIEQEEV